MASLFSAADNLAPPGEPAGSGPLYSVSEESDALMNAIHDGQYLLEERYNGFLMGGSRGGTNSIFGALPAGVEAGMWGMNESYHGIMGLIANSSDDLEGELRHSARARRASTQAERHGPMISSYTQIEGVGDALSYLMGGVGESFPYAAGLLTGGGAVSTVVGGVAKGVAKNQIRKDIRNRLIQNVTKGRPITPKMQKQIDRRFDKVIKKGAAANAAQYGAAGQGLGVTASSIGLETGGMASAQLQEGQLDPDAVMGYGTASGLIGATGAMRLINRVFKNKGLTNLTDASKKTNKFIKAGQDFGFEATTEMLQTSAELAASRESIGKSLDLKTHPLTEDERDALIDAGLKGGFSAMATAGAADLARYGLGKTADAARTHMESTVRDAEAETVAEETGPGPGPQPQTVDEGPAESSPVNSSIFGGQTPFDVAPTQLETAEGPREQSPLPSTVRQERTSEVLQERAEAAEQASTQPENIMPETEDQMRVQVEQMEEGRKPAVQFNRDMELEEIQDTFFPNVDMTADDYYISRTPDGIIVTKDPNVYDAIADTPRHKVLGYSGARMGNIGVTDSTPNGRVGKTAQVDGIGLRDAIRNASSMAKGVPIVSHPDLEIRNRAMSKEEQNARRKKIAVLQSKAARDKNTGPFASLRDVDTFIVENSDGNMYLKDYNDNMAREIEDAFRTDLDAFSTVQTTPEMQTATIRDPDTGEVITEFTYYSAEDEQNEDPVYGIAARLGVDQFKPVYIGRAGSHNRDVPYATENDARAALEANEDGDTWFNRWFKSHGFDLNVVNNRTVTRLKDEQTITRKGNRTTGESFRASAGVNTQEEVIDGWWIAASIDPKVIEEDLNEWRTTNVTTAEAEQHRVWKEQGVYESISVVQTFFNRILVRDPDRITSERQKARENAVFNTERFIEKLDARRERDGQKKLSKKQVKKLTEQRVEKIMRNVPTRYLPFDMGGGQTGYLDAVNITNLGKRRLPDLVHLDQATMEQNPTNVRRAWLKGVDLIMDTMTISDLETMMVNPRFLWTVTQSMDLSEQTNPDPNTAVTRIGELMKDNVIPRKIPDAIKDAAKRNDPKAGKYLVDWLNGTDVNISGKTIFGLPEEQSNAFGRWFYNKYDPKFSPFGYVKDGRFLIGKKVRKGHRDGAPGKYDNTKLTSNMTLRQMWADKRYRDNKADYANKTPAAIVGPGGGISSFDVITRIGSVIEYLRRQPAKDYSDFLPMINEALRTGFDPDQNIHKAFREQLNDAVVKQWKKNYPVQYRAKVAAIREEARDKKLSPAETQQMIDDIPTVKDLDGVVHAGVLLSGRDAMALSEVTMAYDLVNSALTEPALVIPNEEIMSLEASPIQFPQVYNYVKAAKEGNHSKAAREYEQITRVIYNLLEESYNTTANDEAGSYARGLARKNLRQKLAILRNAGRELGHFDSSTPAGTTVNPDDYIWATVGEKLEAPAELGSEDASVGIMDVAGYELDTSYQNSVDEWMDDQIGFWFEYDDDFMGFINEARFREDAVNDEAKDKAVEGPEVIGDPRRDPLNTQIDTEVMDSALNEWNRFTINRFDKRLRKKKVSIDEEQMETNHEAMTDAFMREADAALFPEDTDQGGFNSTDTAEAMKFAYEFEAKVTHPGENVIVKADITHGIAWDIARKIGEAGKQMLGIPNPIMIMDQDSFARFASNGAQSENFFMPADKVIEFQNDHSKNGMVIMPKAADKPVVIVVKTTNINNDPIAMATIVGHEMGHIYYEQYNKNIPSNIKTRFRAEHKAATKDLPKGSYPYEEWFADHTAAMLTQFVSQTVHHHKKAEEQWNKMSSAKKEKSEGRQAFVKDYSQRNLKHIPAFFRPLFNKMQDWYHYLTTGNQFTNALFARTGGIDNTGLGNSTFMSFTGNIIGINRAKQIAKRIYAEMKWSQQSKQAPDIQSILENEFTEEEAAALMESIQSASKETVTPEALFSMIAKKAIDQYSGTDMPIIPTPWRGEYEKNPQYLTISDTMARLKNSRPLQNKVWNNAKRLWKYQQVTLYKRFLEYEGGERLANLFGHAPGKAVGSEAMKYGTYAETIRAESHDWTRQIEDYFKSDFRQERIQAAGVDMLNPDGPQTEDGRAMRRILEAVDANIYEQQLAIREAIGYQYAEGADPMMIHRHKNGEIPLVFIPNILENPAAQRRLNGLLDEVYADEYTGNDFEAFKEFIIEHLRTRGNLDEAPAHGIPPHWAFAMQVAKKIPANRLAASGLIETDALTVLTKHVRNLVIKVNRERRFGNYEMIDINDITKYQDEREHYGTVDTATDKSKAVKAFRKYLYSIGIKTDTVPVWNAEHDLDVWVNDAVEGDEKKVRRDLVDAALNRYQYDKISPKSRANIDAGLQIANMVMLPLALLTAIADTGLMFMMGNDFKTTFRHLMSAVKEFRKEDSEGMILANAMGIITERGLSHAYVEAMQEMDGVPYSKVHKTISQAHNKFFHFNGLEGWSRMHRLTGTTLGVAYIEANYRKALAGDEAAARMMAEIGIDPATAQRWLAAGKPHEGADFRHVRSGVSRFVDMGHLRPDSIDRPLAASHPVWKIFKHLQAFLFAMKRHVIDRYANIAKERGLTEPEMFKAMMGFLFVLLPMAALGMGMRDEIYYMGSDNARPPRDFGDVLSRSGIAGPMTMPLDLVLARNHDLSSFTYAAGGGAFNLLLNFATESPRNALSKVIPLISATREGRDLIKGT